MRGNGTNHRLWLTMDLSLFYDILVRGPNEGLGVQLLVDLQSGPLVEYHPRPLPRNMQIVAIKPDPDRENRIHLLCDSPDFPEHDDGERTLAYNVVAYGFSLLPDPAAAP